MWITTVSKCHRNLNVKPSKAQYPTNFSVTLSFFVPIYKIYEYELIHYYDSHTFLPIWFPKNVHNTQQHDMNHVVLLSFQFVVSFFIHFDYILGMFLYFVFISSKANERMNNRSQQNKMNTCTYQQQAATSTHHPISDLVHNVPHAIHIFTTLQLQSKFWPTQLQNICYFPFLFLFLSRSFSLYICSLVKHTKTGITFHSLIHQPKLKWNWFDICIP